jgi:hypothetical protein
VRSYVNGSDGMGLSMFKHQCYCSTHVIYAFSDYGQFRLPRQLLAEEFEFMVRNIEWCMTFKDPTQAPLVGDLEVVCEFLHCLKLLGYTPEADPELEPLINNVYDYILKREKELSGKWSIKGASKSYDRYHTTFVAAISLEDYSHLAMATMPTILKWM